MITLRNNHLTVCISEHGAELTSIRTAEREYLWQADPEFWARHSPVLFPIVGNVFDKTFRVGDTVYPMGQHGFARDADFEVLRHDDTEAWLEYRSSAETQARFPYAFTLQIGYRLHDCAVDVMWRVVNPSTSETLDFQIGAHPAFYWPEHDASGEARGYFAFDAEGTLTSRKLIGKGCVSPEETFEAVLDEKGMIALNATTFDELDTFIFEGGQVHRVTLCDTERRPLLALSFDAPVVGLWSPPGRRAPFVCIEPWYGRCDTYGYTGDFAHRDWVNHLQPGETFNSCYTIEVC